MTDKQKQDIVEDFIQFCKERLQINKLPPIEYTNDRDWAVERHSFGEYSLDQQSLIVYTGNRNLADLLRTLGHELVHHRQHELGMIKGDNDGSAGSPIENEANSVAGVLMRDYGKTNELIYEALLPTLKQIYEVDNSNRIQIYCDMDGVLCDFDKRFEHYYGDTPLEYKKKYKPEEATNYLNQAVDKAGVQYWSKMDWMPGGKELWSTIAKYTPIILTSPGKFKYAREGKKTWIQNNLSPKPKDIIFANTGNKADAIAGKPENEIKRSILIDDFWSNLAPWKQLGGIAIMHKDISKTKDILSKFRIK